MERSLTRSIPSGAAERPRASDVVSARELLDALEWPAPGLPCRIRQNEMSIVLALRSPRDALRRVQGLALERVHDGARSRLQPLRVLRVDRQAARETVGAASSDDWLGDRQRIRIDFLVDGARRIERPRSVSVHHLVLRETRVRSRAVYEHFGDSQRLCVGFVSDLHLARLFDELESSLGHIAPELLPRLRSPRRALKALVRSVNDLARDGGIDALVLGGDLIDHVAASDSLERDRSRRATNLDDLVAAMDRLEVPTFATPGNHELRSYRRRLRAWGLDELGLGKSELRAALQSADCWDPAPLRISDLESLRSRDRSGVTALDDFRRALAPATEYHVDLSGVRLVFASSGRDLLPRAFGLERGRRRLFVRTIARSLDPPDLEGLHDAQVAAIGEAFAGCDSAVLFLHAPPLAGAKERFAPLRLGAGIAPLGAAQEVRRVAERALLATGLREGVVFRNGPALLDVLLRHSSARAVVSGHVHRFGCAVVDPASTTLRAGAPRPGSTDPGVALLTAPSAALHRPGGREPSGWLLLRLDHGHLTSVQRFDLPAAAAP